MTGGRFPCGGGSAPLCSATGGIFCSACVSQWTVIHHLPTTDAGGLTKFLDAALGNLLCPTMRASRVTKEVQMAQMIKKKKILPAMQGGVKVAQPYLTLCNPMDSGPPGSSVHGDFPGKNTGVGCHSLLQGSSCPGDQTQVSCIADGFFTLSYRKLETKYCVMAYMGKESKTSGYMYLCNRFTLLYT